mmetsp:Transcript_8652/g.15713  ORF Transcript_8652/g.15713 Transcript_8652/m.15713 type:complete len:202 (-) Transcript_8652:692-1297(-)
MAARNFNIGARKSHVGGGNEGNSADDNNSDGYEGEDEAGLLSVSVGKLGGVFRGRVGDLRVRVLGEVVNKHAAVLLVKRQELTCGVELLYDALDAPVLVERGHGGHEEENARRHSAAQPNASIGGKRRRSEDEENWAHVSVKDVGKRDHLVLGGRSVVEEPVVGLVVSVVVVGLEIFGDLKYLVLLPDQVHIVERRNYLPE